MQTKQYDYYGASGIIDKVDDYLFEGEYILVGEDGANLLSRSTPLAFKACGKFWVNNHAHILKPKGENILAYYVHLLETLDYTVLVTGSAQPKLTQEALGNQIIIEPTIKDQISIVEFIKDKEKKILSSILHIEKELALIEEYRTALINEAVTGKIKVTESV
jgi:type I restriction enzyme S subunit